MEVKPALFSKRDSCSRGQAKARLIFLALIFVVAAGGGVCGLVLAAGVGIQAAFEGDEIIEELQRDEVREGGEPLAGIGACFRDDESVLRGNIVIC